jgi:hypothetical protein
MCRDFNENLKSRYITLVLQNGISGIVFILQVAPAPALSHRGEESAWQLL